METASTSADKKPICLLVHGFNGEPQEMEGLRDCLAAEFTTRKLLLPGHGTHLQDLATCTWADWLAYVLSEVRSARDAGRRIFIIGHSLGATLALAVAETESNIAGVVCLCPIIRMSALQRALISVLPYAPNSGDISDRRFIEAPNYRRTAYHWSPLAPMRTVLAAWPKLREALPKIACPALVICARHDHTAPMQDGVEVYTLLGSQRKDLLILQRSYHMVTLDFEHDEVFRRTLNFCVQIADG